MTEAAALSVQPAWPSDGDLVRSRMGGEAWARVHIATAERVASSWDPNWIVLTACGRRLLRTYLLPASDTAPRQCLACHGTQRTPSGLGWPS